MADHEVPSDLRGPSLNGVETRAVATAPRPAYLCEAELQLCGDSPTNPGQLIGVDQIAFGLGAAS